MSRSRNLSKQDLRQDTTGSLKPRSKELFNSPTPSSSREKRRSTPHFDKGLCPWIKQYKLSKTLGDGAFGRCFKAESRRSGRQYAIKVIKPVRRHIKNARVECRIARTVNRRLGSEYFAKLHDSFDFGDNFIMIFELLGINLGDLLELNRDRGFPLPVVQNWARQLLKALKALHSIGYVHTDLKVT